MKRNMFSSGSASFSICCELRKLPLLFSAFVALVFLDMLLTAAVACSAVDKDARMELTIMLDVCCTVTSLRPGAL